MKMSNREPECRISKSQIKISAPFSRSPVSMGVDYALKKDTSSQPPRYLVFFKARDTDALTAAFREFSGKQLKRNKKPSILVQLKKFQEQMVNHDRARNRAKNGIER